MYNIHLLSKKPINNILFYIYANTYAKVTMSQGLCKYRDALGKPRQGVHAWRIGTDKYNFAANDIISTFVGAGVIAGILWYFHVFNIGGMYLYGIVLSSLFLLGIILHRLFCVKTTLGQLILPVPWTTDIAGTMNHWYCRYHEPLILPVPWKQHLGTP